MMKNVASRNNSALAHYFIVFQEWTILEAKNPLAQVLAASPPQWAATS